MLKLMLVEDDKILWEIPLYPRSWDNRALRREFREFDKEIERFETLFTTLSNVGRMQMMRSFFEAKDSLTFTELMKMHEMNPKIVSDGTKRLTRTGLIEKDREGRYKPTSRGEAEFMMMSVALRRMMKVLDQL
jgi:DNA-binding HxlR family transcriptional regulator